MERVTTLNIGGNVIVNSIGVVSVSQLLKTPVSFFFYFSNDVFSNLQDREEQKGETENCVELWLIKNLNTYN